MLFPVVCSFVAKKRTAEQFQSAELNVDLAIVVLLDGKKNTF